MESNVDVNTSVKDKVITTSVDFKSPLGEIENRAKHIIDTQEKQVQEALISLGWTPPAEEEVDNNGTT